MKERIKERWGFFTSEVRRDYIMLTLGDTSCITRGDRLTMIAAIIASLFVVASGTAFAAGNEDKEKNSGGGLIEQAGNIASGLYGDIAAGITKFAALAAGICIVWFFLCTNEEDAKRPIKWLKRIFIGYIIFMILGAVFAFIESQTSSMHQSFGS